MVWYGMVWYGMAWHGMAWYVWTVCIDCMYVCMYLCIYVSMYLCMYVCMYVRIGDCLSDYVLIVNVKVDVPVMTLQGHQLPHCNCFL